MYASCIYRLYHYGSCHKKSSLTKGIQTDKLHYKDIVKKGKIIQTKFDNYTITARNNMHTKLLILVILQ